jgi:hypothetical protein
MWVSVEGEKGWGEEYDGDLLQHCCKIKPEVQWPLGLVDVV